VINWEFYEHHFGPPRLRHYLSHCDGDVANAMKLYRWNVAISAAFWESLTHLEVAFRNAIDGSMSDRHARLGRSGHWVFDNAHELGRDAQGPKRHRQPFADVEAAKLRVRRKRKALDAGQIISELSFGFWHQMVSQKQMFLWPDLASAFVNAPDRRQATVHDPMSRLRAFRNRIGHHHRIWSEDINARYDDVLNLAGFMDSKLQTFIEDHGRVQMMLQNGP
jgi:hypothetical protein